MVPFFWPYLTTGANIMLPFGIAVFVSILLEPIVKFFARVLHISRGAATGLAMLTFFGGGAAVFFLIIGRLIYELIRLSRLLPAYKDDIVGTLDYLVNQGYIYWHQTNILVQGLDPELQKQISDNLKAIVASLETGTSQLLQSLLGSAQYIPSGVITFFTVVLITLLATYFISKDRQEVIDFWMRIIPPPYGRKFINIVVEVSAAFAKYLRAQIILLSITMLVSIIGLTMIGADYALTLGLLVGFMDIIPVLGPGSIYVPWIIGAYIAGNSLLALKLVLLYALVVILRQVLETKVVADSLGLHPLATIISMYVGLNIIGFSGLFLGPIIVIAIKAIVKAGVIKIKY